MTASADIKKIERTFLPKDLVVDKWETIEPFFKELLEREITSKESLEKWLKDTSELEAVISEDACWRQIKMTCDTTDKKLEEAFNFFCMEIQPMIQPYADALNKKLINSPFTQALEPEKYFTYLRSVKKSIELFREENIPLQSELAVMQQQYCLICGKMSKVVKVEEYTLHKLANFSKSQDRDLRE